MRRNYNFQKLQTNEYIDVRISQLKEDMAKASDPMDQAWYNRLIQELDWVKQMESKPTHNCYIGQELTGTMGTI
jgi:hypothetical protein